MTTIYQGHTYEISREQRDANRTATLAAIEADRIWFESIQQDRKDAEIRAQLQADYDAIQIERAEADAEYREMVYRAGQEAALMDTYDGGA